MEVIFLREGVKGVCFLRLPLDVFFLTASGLTVFFELTLLLPIFLGFFLAPRFTWLTFFLRF
jgi:hypothetical protein